MSLRRALPTALAALALAACGSPAPDDGSAAPDDGRIRVVTSTNVYGSIARAVGGDGVSVESLVTDPAADPHSYESTPADALTVSEARIVVLNGGGYDAFMSQLVEAAGGDRTVVEVAALEDGAEHAADGTGHAHAEGNEHLWYDLAAMQALAGTLAMQLGAADPAGAATYTANAEAFDARLAQLVDRTGAIAAAHRGARVAVTEPLPGHLIEAAGLVDATPPAFTEAVEEDTDPPAAVVQDTLALFAGDPVRALVVNGQTATATTEQVRAAAEAAGVPVVEMTETLPPGEDYVTWMGAQIDALAGALGGA